MGWARDGLGLGAVWFCLAAGGCKTQTFVCEDAGECGSGGQCEANGYCSFADPECPSGRRYGDLAGEGLGGTCVPPFGGSGSTSTGPPPTSTAGPTTTSEGSTSTASTTVGLTDSADATTSMATTLTTAPPTSSTTDPGTGTSESTGEPIVRVTEDNIILYRFDEGLGDAVTDYGTYPGESAMDLTVTGTMSWVADGLQITDAIATPTAGSSTKLRNALTDSNELTVETWVTPGSTDQPGPARIVTYSIDSTLRTFTLGQGTGTALTDGLGLAFRLWTTTTTENGMPQLQDVTPLPAGLLHIAYTRDTVGDEVLYLDGDPIISGVRTGTIQVDVTYGFALGNELSLDRPWDGTYHLVAIYNRALSSDEVAQNIAAGF